MTVLVGKLRAGQLFVAPMVSFDFLNMSANHTFTGGSFLGTTEHWTLTGGANVGKMTHGMTIYGHGGFGVMNEDLVINFGGPVTSNSTTVTGFAVGGGVEWAPQKWAARSRPMSIIVEYQHEWWATGR